MFMPPLFAEDDHETVLGLVRSAGFGHLVYSTATGIESSPIPFIVNDSLETVMAHVARANPIVRNKPTDALLIVPVTDAYISPSWYPSKAEHGKVVPTWNYEVVHLHGRLSYQDDAAWLAAQIGELTDQNEATQRTPWDVEDAPDDFIEKQIKAIVGVELTVSRVEGKRKLSQNREAPDHDGAVEGLRTRGARSAAVADAMAARSPTDQPG